MGQKMTLVRKGSRQIVVDGATYRWRVRHKRGYSQGNGWTPLTFAVEDAAAPSTTLVVRTDHAHGWTPDATGSPFLLALNASSAL